jgi:hypothetical protein
MIGSRGELSGERKPVIRGAGGGDHGLGLLGLFQIRIHF